MSILARRISWSGTVTLAAANTPYNLRALINAILLSSNAEIPEAYRECLLQSHPGIDGSGGNSNDIIIGDSKLTTSNIGYVLQIGQSRQYRSDVQNGLFSDIWVQSAGTSQKLNVDFVSC